MSIRTALISRLARHRTDREGRHGALLGCVWWVACGACTSTPPANMAPAQDAGAGADSGEVTDADLTTQCQLNADCVDSEAGRQAQILRCASTDLYCLNAHCSVECGKRCQVVVSDQNPCEAPRLCAPLAGSGVSFCTILPIKCASPADCPVYLPTTGDGGQSSWSCDNGICQYPGWTYATK